MRPEWILYEDRDIIVCHKASGIATQTARIGQPDMVSEIMNYLAHGKSDQDYSAPERKESMRNVPYVGVVHRLDQPVEGVLVFAKNKNAAARLGRQITDKGTEKDYYAIICGRNFVTEGILEDYLLKDGRANISTVVPAGTKDAKRAVLEYKVLTEKVVPADPKAEKCGAEAESTTYGSQSGGFRIALVRIRLHTGRHHQIRVQMSHAGMGLLGDTKYADAAVMRVSEQMQVKEIALCAYRLAFRHPGTGEWMQFQGKPEGSIFQIKEFLPYYA